MTEADYQAMTALELRQAKDNPTLAGYLGMRGVDDQDLYGVSAQEQQGLYGDFMDGYRKGVDDQLNPNGLKRTFLGEEPSKGAGVYGQTLDDVTKALQPALEWEARPANRAYIERDPVKTTGPVRVDVWSNTFGRDGTHYDVEWHPLDPSGVRDPSGKGIVEPGVINNGLTGLLQELLGVAPPHNIHKPPVDHPFGWEVEVSIPPQQDPNGNRIEPHANIYRSKPPK